MSEQYAKKKISDIQKSITFWELECIHEEGAKKTLISVGEFAHSNEDKKNQNSIDQVHLWEIYSAKRKRIIIASFTIVFILLISALLFASPYIFECFPIQSENKYNKQKISNDTLISINETVNLVKKNVTVENKRSNKIILKDTSEIKGNSSFNNADSNSDQINLVIENNTKSARNRGIISSFGVICFFIFYPFISICISLIWVKKLVKHLFGKSSIKYTNPNEN